VRQHRLRRQELSAVDCGGIEVESIEDKVLDRHIIRLRWKGGRGVKGRKKH